MLQLIYTSVAAHRLNSAQLHDLLAQARDANLRHDISGMLVYDQGVFLQVIEGPDAAIGQLRSNIELDPRHHSFRLLHCANVGTREFGEWSMAFAAPEAGMATIDGFLDLRTESLGAPLGATKAQQMLNLFKEGGVPAQPLSGPSEVKVSLAPASRSTNARLDAKAGRAYLEQLAHAIALSMPDVGTCVEIAPGDVISYNTHRDLMRGEAELF